MEYKMTGPIGGLAKKFIQGLQNVKENFDKIDFDDISKTKNKDKNFYGNLDNTIQQLVSTLGYLLTKLTNDTVSDDQTEQPETPSQPDNTTFEVIDDAPSGPNPTTDGIATEAGNGDVIGLDSVLLTAEIEDILNPPAPPPPPPPATVVDVLVEKSGGGTPNSNFDDFNILLTLVGDVGLTDALTDMDAELTVFAPTDRAFRNLAIAVGVSEDNLQNDRDVISALSAFLLDAAGGDQAQANELLKDILLYHVAPGKIVSEDGRLVDGTTVNTLNGDDFTVSVFDQD